MAEDAQKTEMMGSQQDNRWVVQSNRYMGDCEVYLRLCNHLFSNYIDDNELVTPPPPNESNVGLVLLAFAAELAYKSVVAANGIKPHGSHKLTAVRNHLNQISSPVRKRIDRHIQATHMNPRNRLNLHQRNLTAVDLYRWVDKKISYMERRYWFVSRSGDFSATEIPHLYADYTCNPSNLTAVDVYWLAKSLLRMARETIGNNDVSETRELSWQTNDLASGFPDAPTETYLPPNR